jgi:hypothetical protein
MAVNFPIHVQSLGAMKLLRMRYCDLGPLVLSSYNKQPGS